MNQKQQIVIEWWNSGRNYREGVALFTRFGNNKVLLHTLSKQAEKYGADKLAYQLTKSVGLDWLKMPSSSVPVPGSGSVPVHVPVTGRAPRNKIPNKREQKETGSVPVETAGIEPDRPVSVDQRDSSFPLVIRRLKYEYSDLYNRRSVLHKGMSAVPADNSAKSMERRATLLREIHELSDRMDFIYPFIEAYESTGVIPVTEEIWPAKDAKALPEDPGLLRKLKKQLQSANLKDKNQLLYRQNKKADKQNPMPDGPRRIKIEARIKAKEQRIEQINAKIIQNESAV